MSEHQFHCHVARFEPHFCGYRRDRRSSALVITLVVLALVSILVIAFLGLASQDLKSTNFYVRSEQADQIARGGLDFIVGNLREEISDPTLSASGGTASSPFFVPINGINTFPMRMVPLSVGSTNILLTSSNSLFYVSGPSTMGSAISSTNISLNNQVITPSDWNRPMLVPSSQVQNMPIPNWVFVSRTGPVSLPAGTVSSTVSQNLNNAGGVIGRYAFVVYDTSGLLDINVAGYDSGQASMATNAAGKGLLPYADLTQLPGIAPGDVNALVQFRNVVSETNYPMALTNSNGSGGLLSNGFMQVYAPITNGATDSTFLSRQELIQYASNNADWINALPYLTTFSRELNGPTWGPTTNAPGASYQYQRIANSSSTATATSTINPNTYAVKVPASWVGNSTNPTRNNGQPWVANEPLMKYRFPLDKLALLAKAQSTLTTQEIKEVQEYFGLDVASDISASSDPHYQHWVYPTQSSTYLHTDNNILTLAQIANLAIPREPDFFELLQAGILNGSLGGSGRGDGSTPVTLDYDPKTTPHILRIGANIINQWKSDNFPVTISYLLNNGGDELNVYGVSDLPYITQLFTKCYSPTGSTIGYPAQVPIYPYIYFQSWNPHQPPSNYNAANYPSNLRIVPYYYSANSTYIVANSDNVLYGVLVTLSGMSGAFKWFYTPTYGYSASSGAVDLFSLSTSVGGGYETNSSAGVQYAANFNPLTDYREPGLVVGTPAPAAPWTPTIPTPSSGGPPSGEPAAISLPEIPSLPATINKSNSYPGSGWAPATNIYWQPNFASTNAWKVALQIQTAMAQQFKDQNGNWHTYAMFEGTDDQSPGVTSYPGWHNSAFFIPTGSTSTDDQSFAKTDPRTSRFGPAGILQQQGVTNHASDVSTLAPNSTHPPLLSPALSSGSTNNIAWDTFETTPFTNTSSTVTAPFRMDYWAANSQANPIQGAYYTGSQNPYYADPDGTVRGGDSAYAYSTSVNGWGNNPEVPGTTFPTVALPGRPVMLNHPFNSVGDLGYVYRDDPWRTLDFMTAASADAGLLDLFSLSEAPVVAGRINPNTPYPQIIQALVNGATQSSVNGVSGATPTVPSSTAQAIAQSLVSFTSTSSITNRAALVTSGAVSNVINSGAFTDGGNASKVKTEGEALVRSLAESSNTRTWNLLIDVIGQSGHFINNSAPVSSGGRDNFVVEGERHYWLHVAIDRFTGQVVDEQLELVDQ